MAESGIRCANPPKFLVSVSIKQDEYMLGVACDMHRQAVAARIHMLQNSGRLPRGSINFTELKAVGTDCVRASQDDYIGIDRLS